MTPGEIVSRQRKFFDSGQTRDYAFRERALRTLRAVIETDERKIFEALKKDLGKCDFEAYLGEVGICLSEISDMLKHLKAWMRPRKVGTPLNLFPGSSWIYPDPYGVCLIMAPWNYPFNLAIAPLVGAIAGGNCAILKPSELAPNVSRVLAELLGAAFDPEHIAVVEGDLEVNKAVLRERYDLIFFTGSTAVGKIVMRAAAEHLTPVVLELGGKSPCIVDADADIEVASRRIGWGKYLNAGQTCVAPDYLLVHETVKDAFVGALKRRLGEFYGEDPAASPDYPRIISERHFDRLADLLAGQSVIHGGQRDRESKYFAPTLVDAPRWQDPIMQEEIFGPLLPILAFHELDDAIRTINERPKPLALYYFGRDPERQERVLSRTSSGGGCVNETVMHLVNSNLPFGGVGASGMGAYHGRDSFETFTHAKSVLKRPCLFDNPLRYAPYGDKLRFLRFFLS